MPLVKISQQTTDERVEIYKNCLKSSPNLSWLIHGSNQSRPRKPKPFSRGRS